MFQFHDSNSPSLEPNPNDLAEAVAQIAQADLVGDSQQALRSDVLEFCEANPDALHRSCVDGHLTASSLVVNQDRTEVLIIHHAKLRRWLQPGGHADGNGNLRRVAWDEATEETGIQDLRVIAPAIDIDIHTIPARGEDPEHRHLDLRFLVLAPADAAVTTNHESTGFEWVGKSHELVEDNSDLERAIGRALDVAQALSSE